MKRGQKTGAEQVVLKLRQVEVQTVQGKSLALGCKEAEISEQGASHWRKEYGGLQIDQTRRMKDLERENTRLRRLGADFSLVGQVLADVAAGAEGQRQQNLSPRSDAGRPSTAFVRSMVSQNTMPAGSLASRPVAFSRRGCEECSS